MQNVSFYKTKLNVKMSANPHNSVSCHGAEKFSHVAPRCAGGANRIWMRPARNPMPAIQQQHAPLVLFERSAGENLHTQQAPADKKASPPRAFHAKEVLLMQPCS